MAASSKVSTGALSSQDQDALTELLSSGSVENFQYYLPALRGLALLKHVVAIGSNLHRRLFACDTNLLLSDHIALSKHLGRIELPNVSFGVRCKVPVYVYL